jgi:hypothetical protein
VPEGPPLLHRADLTPGADVARAGTPRRGSVRSDGSDRQPGAGADSPSHSRAGSERSAASLARRQDPFAAAVPLSARRAAEPPQAPEQGSLSARRAVELPPQASRPPSAAPPVQARAPSDAALVLGRSSSDVSRGPPAETFRYDIDAEEYESGDTGVRAPRGDRVATRC